MKAKRKALTEEEKEIVKRLKRKLRRIAMGYEYSLSFADGYISALFGAGLITRKFKRELMDNFATEQSDYPHTDRFPEYFDYVEWKYGRTLTRP